MFNKCKVRSLNIKAHCMLCEIHPCMHGEAFHIQQAKLGILRQPQPLSVWPHIVAVCISTDHNNMDGSLTKDCPLLLPVLY